MKAQGSSSEGKEKRREDRRGAWTPHEVEEMPRRGFQKLIGVKLIEAKPERVLASLSLRDRHSNSVGGVHGGLLMALGDSLGGMGAVQNLHPGQRTATLESKTNFLKAPAGMTLTAECRPLHLGRTTSVWQTSIRDAEDRLVAIVTQTQLHIADA